MTPEPFRWTAEALLALQEVRFRCWLGQASVPRELTRAVCCLQSMEDFMVHLFEDCNLCAIHAKRVTISECLPCRPHAMCPAVPYR